MDYKFYNELADSGMGLIIPLLNHYTANSVPVIGTTISYFHKKNYPMQNGHYFQVIGQAILGFKAARKLGKAKGDSIITDIGSLYNVAGSYPLELKITGILAKTNSPDDDVIFTDLKTTWIMAGIGHGHEDLLKSDESVILKKAENSVTANKKLLEYTKITRDNLDSFHFHGNNDFFPINALLVYPKNKKQLTIYKAKTNISDNLQAVVPLAIINKLMALVFNIEKIVWIFFLFIIISTTLFIFLIFSLILQIRKREIRMIGMIGGSRYSVFTMMSLHIGIIVLSSLVLSLLAAKAIQNLLPVFNMF